ncbi:MAG TPA: VOC family protein [Sphingomicrobium sp.]|nr:VOC family protein [Sphingomicrobium sp.]
MPRKIQPCLWFDKNAEEAANFYATTFPDSRIERIDRAPGDYPNGKAGDVLVITMTILGMPFMLLNAGPEFRFTEAVSFQVSTDDQDETDRYWNAIVSNGGEESVCGWCKDRFGLSWQITPKRLTELMASPASSKAAFNAMMTMRKINIAALDAAVEAASVHA